MQQITQLPADGTTKQDEEVQPIVIRMLDRLETTHVNSSGAS